jgi:hypothetical protein
LSRRNLITPFLFALLILTLFFTFTPQINVKAGIYPQISIIPQAIYAVPGQEFNVSVTISDVTNLYGYQVYINFSSEVLEVVDVIQGDFLKRGTYNTFWQPKWDNTVGQIQVWESMLRPDPASSGSGELFKVNFNVKKAGSSMLQLWGTDLVDPYQAKIKHTTNDGLVATVKIELTPKEMKGREYGPGSTASVNVTLAGAVENLYGFDLTIKYNTTIINATSVNLYELLGEPNENYTNINTDEGIINLNVTCKLGASPTNATGSLATITFDIVGIGETSIDIINSRLIDVNGEDIIPILESAYLYGVFRNIGIISSETLISPLSVTAGENLTLNLGVFNDGIVNETFTAIVYAYGADGFNAIIGGPKEYAIESESNKTLEITLSTIGLGGNYTVIVKISYVPGEADLTDNEYQYPSLIIVRPLMEASIFPFESLLYAVVIIVVVVIVGLAIYKKRKKT